MGFVLKAGAELAYENYILREEYYETSLDCYRDSNGVIYYLDSNGVATNNMFAIKGHTTETGKVESVYRVAGIHPFVTLEKSGTKIPLSAALKFCGRINYYYVKKAFDNDPFNWVNAYKGHHWKFEPMFYLSLSLYIDNDWFQAYHRNE